MANGSASLKNISKWLSSVEWAEDKKFEDVLGSQIVTDVHSAVIEVLPEIRE